MNNLKTFTKFIFGWASAILGRSTKKNVVSKYWLYNIGSNCWHRKVKRFKSSLPTKNIISKDYLCFHNSKQENWGKCIVEF